MRPGLLAAHRRLGLAVAMVWALQAVTGLALVFRVEIDNALTHGASAPLDPTAMGAALAALPGKIAVPVVSITAADRAATRYDAFDANDRRVARMSGRGELIASGHGLDLANRLDVLKSLHESFWLGDNGSYFVGLSGLLLLSNMVLGLKLAWPLKGRWRALLPQRNAPAPVAAFQWHRVIGLGFAAPAVVLFLAGVSMALGDPIADKVGAERTPPPARTATQPATLSFDSAIAIALRRHPDARVTVIDLPVPDAPWYRLRLRQPGELQRFYGQTAIFIDGRTGAVLTDYDSRRAPPVRAFFDGFYPIHTLEFAGVAGRLIAAGVGLWLLTVIGLGLTLWRARRRLRAAT
ncbi:MAG: PepSY domain-containing protein [Proteobacteria bacterium]|nr:PepSY domain-containing protein [Pseudomonadota bacterium]